MKNNIKIEYGRVFPILLNTFFKHLLRVTKQKFIVREYNILQVKEEELLNFLRLSYFSAI